jgi:hypothetical protein
MRTGLKVSTFFWVISQCDPMIVKQYFEGRCYPHLQGRRTSQTRNQPETGGKHSTAYSSSLKMEVRRSSATSADSENFDLCTVYKYHLTRIIQLRISQSIIHSLKWTISYIYKLDIHKCLGQLKKGTYIQGWKWPLRTKQMVEICRKFKAENIKRIVLQEN